MEEGQKTIRGIVFPTTVDHDRQIQPAFVGLGVGDVRHLLALGWPLNFYVERHA
jgi:hypothetical protein